MQQKDAVVEAAIISRDHDDYFLRTATARPHTTAP